MVQIYREPLAVRHHARLFSSAVFVRFLAVISTIALAFTLTYTSGGLWRKTKVEYEQPTVKFGYGMLVIFESTSPGEARMWSSFPGQRQLYGDRLVSMAVEAQEYDDNFDGKADVITITAVARGLNLPVHSVKALLDFEYQLEDSVRLQMAPTVYVTHASPVPGAALYTVGELSLWQRDPLLANSRTSTYNESLLVPPLMRNLSYVNEHLNTVQSIVAATSMRNESAFYEHMQPVWLAGSSHEFKLEMRFVIPSSQAVLLRPREVEMLKFGWVQFLAVLAIFWFILSWAEYVVFHFRMLRTRVVSDLSRPKQKF